ncbi:YdcH family protein [Marinibaculum pumilum]|uniref:YdcH family protein n=1 Tax=Marinibaculum pumilum TaxID=1766165 RepID=A0ABV7L6I7_9PROT
MTGDEGNEGQAEALRQLEELRAEHRDLDDAINALLDRPTFNHLQIQRMKKRKLLLKDEIIRLESQLIPDIIA